MGLLQDPVKVVEFLKSGQVESLTEDKFQDSILIRSENEALKKGETPIVMITDVHSQHILEHKEVLNDPDSRLDPNIVNNTLAHIQEHIQAYKSIDPDLAAILQLQPLPSMQVPPQQEQPIPEIAGQNVPGPPNGTPPQIEQGYDETMNNIANTQGEQV